MQEDLYLLNVVDTLLFLHRRQLEPQNDVEPQIHPGKPQSRVEL